jgi:hypothetical protein
LKHLSLSSSPAHPVSFQDEKVVTTRRIGGKYEAVGFVLILFGFIFLLVSPIVGSLMLFIGFVIFLIGRFM